MTGEFTLTTIFSTSGTNYLFFNCKKYITLQVLHYHIVPVVENAVSEITAVILLTAVIAAAAGIYVAAVLPEMEKAEEIEVESAYFESFFQLKAGIDELWLTGNPSMTGGILLLAGGSSPYGTLQISNGTEISFTHTEGSVQTTLLCICMYPSFRHLADTPVIYEGGAVFAGDVSILSPSAATRRVILVCSDGAEETLSANVPAAVRYTFRSAETYTNVTNLRVDGTDRRTYWMEQFLHTETITLLFFEASLEAAA